MIIIDSNGQNKISVIEDKRNEGFGLSTFLDYSGFNCSIIQSYLITFFKGHHCWAVLRASAGLNPALPKDMLIDICI